MLLGRLGSLVTSPSFPEAPTRALRACVAIGSLLWAAFGRRCVCVAFWVELLIVQPRRSVSGGVMFEITPSALRLR